MPDTPLNPDGVECAKDAMRRVLELDSNDSRELAWESLAPADYPDAVAKPMIAAYLNTLPDSLRLSDEEWQAFQAIPDQGYSHRAWVDARIAERVAVAQPEVNSVEGIPAQVQVISWEEEPEHECWKLAPNETFVGLIVKSDRAWSPADRYTLNIERPAVNDA